MNYPYIHTSAIRFHTKREINVNIETKKKRNKKYKLKEKNAKTYEDREVNVLTTKRGKKEERDKRNLENK